MGLEKLSHAGVNRKEEETMKYSLIDSTDDSGGTTLEFEGTLEEARARAKTWVTEDLWQAYMDCATGESYFAEIDIYEIDDTIVEGENESFVDSLTVVVDPPEPDCIDNEGHDWQSPVEIVGGIKEAPGVWGHGGGVTITEACMKCGCGKFTDTWATNPNDGTQGHKTVAYTPGKYADRIPQEEN